MFPSARSVLKSNCPVHTHLMVPGFTLEKLGLYVVSPYCVACMMQALSATRADTYTNELKNTKGSAIGNYLGNQHDIEPENIAQCFRISRKCQNKFDCLVFYFEHSFDVGKKQYRHCLLVYSGLKSFKTIHHLGIHCLFFMPRSLNFLVLQHLSLFREYSRDLLLLIKSTRTLIC